MRASARSGCYTFRLQTSNFKSTHLTSVKGAAHLLPYLVCVPVAVAMILPNLAFTTGHSQPHLMQRIPLSPTCTLCLHLLDWLHQPEFQNVVTIFRCTCTHVFVRLSWFDIFCWLHNFLSKPVVGPLELVGDDGIDFCTRCCSGRVYFISVVLSNRSPWSTGCRSALAVCRYWNSLGLYLIEIHPGRVNHDEIVLTNRYRLRPQPLKRKSRRWMAPVVTQISLGKYHFCPYLYMNVILHAYICPTVPTPLDRFLLVPF